MYINGKFYDGNKNVEGIDPKLFDEEREWNSKNSLGKIGGECIGQGIIKGMQKEVSKCSRYLEVGTFDGILLSILAEKYRDKEFHAVDAFKPGGMTGPGCLNYFIRNCSRFSNIYLWFGKSVDVLRNVPGKFEIIFVDGDHDYENVSYDLMYCYENLLAEKGMMFMHDIHMPGVKQAIKELCGKHSLQVQPHMSLCHAVRKHDAG